jgi:hypothetical protein
MVNLELQRREHDGRISTVWQQHVFGRDLPVSISVSGTGTVEFIVVVDGIGVGSQLVTFD